ANQLITQAQNEAQTKELIKQHVEIVNLRNDIELVDTSYVHLAAHEEIDEIRSIIDKDAQIAVGLKQKEKRVAGAKKMQENIKKEQQAKQPEEEFIEVYEVTGTESQLDALEEHMSSQCLTWSVVEESV